MVHLGKPVGIYILSVRSARPNRDLQGVLFNMLLSFGTVAASLWPAIKDSEAYSRTFPAIRVLVSAGRGALQLISSSLRSGSQSCKLSLR